MSADRYELARLLSQWVPAQRRFRYAAPPFLGYLEAPSATTAPSPHLIVQGWLFNRGRRVRPRAPRRGGAVSRRAARARVRLLGGAAARRRARATARARAVGLSRRRAAAALLSLSVVGRRRRDVERDAPGTARRAREVGGAARVR